MVVDPYRNATAAKADRHLMLRPGSDGALAVAVMHVLFADGYADRDYLARHTDADPALEAHLADRAGRTGRPRSPASPLTKSGRLPASTARPSAAFSGSAMVSPARATVRSTCTRSVACRR